MTPETISALVNLGSAGAVIAVVWKFLEFITKRDEKKSAEDATRDAEWRTFFTALNSTNKDDVCKLAETMERIAKALDAHDEQAKRIGHVVDQIDSYTRPRPGEIGFKDERRKVE
jgi:hypothetical protein